ncbi:hypothetical protein GBF38_002142 [Nibea albiflora]|uniref:Uncharacterized protein n=1 Tax=Nibea albiflora TaxID=240163 RepID=A0ACB7EGP4_NIBAL|nr:hypothetical protein GBF38_002142 [Nibea albiflora]
MSNNSRPKSTCFGSDIHRLLLAAEAGQKVDILTYSSGHLGPRSLNQSQPQKEKNQSFWNMSQRIEGTPNPLTVQQTQTKTLTFVKKNGIKESPSEFSTGTALVESGVSRSRQGQATDRSSQADRKNKSLPKIVYCASDSLPVQPRAFSQKKSNFSADPEGKQQFCLSHSDEKKQLETKQRFGRQVIGKLDPRAGINVAEMHERKLEKSPNTSLKDLGNGKVREMELEDAEKEVSRLEQEAREALEENKRVRNELQNVPTITGPEDSDMKNRSLSELQDRGTAIGCTASVQSKRLQVVNVWREIQQLEEEIKEKMVSTAAATATERSIKELKVLQD